MLIRINGPSAVFWRFREPRGPQSPPAEARRIRLSPGVPRRLRSAHTLTGRMQNRQKRGMFRMSIIICPNAVFWSKPMCALKRHAENSGHGKTPESQGLGSFGMTGHAPGFSSGSRGVPLHETSRLRFNSSLSWAQNRTADAGRPGRSWVLPTLRTHSRSCGTATRSCRRA